jgi:hypothetical protein
MPSLFHNGRRLRMKKNELESHIEEEASETCGIKEGR